MGKKSKVSGGIGRINGHARIQKRAGKHHPGAGKKKTDVKKLIFPTPGRSTKDGVKKKKRKLKGGSRRYFRKRVGKRGRELKTGNREPAENLGQIIFPQKKEKRTEKN